MSQRPDEQQLDAFKKIRLRRSLTEKTRRPLKQMPIYFPFLNWLSTVRTRPDRIRAVFTYTILRALDPCFLVVTRDLHFCSEYLHDPGPDLLIRHLVHRIELRDGVWDQEHNPVWHDHDAVARKLLEQFKRDVDGGTRRLVAQVTDIEWESCSAAMFMNTEMKDSDVFLTPRGVIYTTERIHSSLHERPHHEEIVAQFDRELTDLAAEAGESLGWRFRAERVGRAMSSDVVTL
jgi:hypothetical protein